MGSVKRVVSFQLEAGFRVRSVEATMPAVTGDGNPSHAFPIHQAAASRETLCIGAISGAFTQPKNDSSDN